MARVAFITCGNLKNELNCSSVECHRQFNARTGAFAQHAHDEVYELVGTITCAGCPTLVAHERILHKIKPLVELSQADKIHLSSCMVGVCPFVSKYKKIIEEAYPQVDVVLGTHYMPDPALQDQIMEWFRGMVKSTLCKPKPNMTDSTLELMASMAQMAPPNP